MDTQIALLFVVGFGVSILCSAFFSGAETALLSLGRIDMQRLREKGGRRAVLVYDEMGRRHAGPQHPVRTHGVSGHGQASKRRAEVVEREPGVEEGSDDHVAGDARKCIEIQYA